MSTNELPPFDYCEEFNSAEHDWCVQTGNCRCFHHHEMMRLRRVNASLVAACKGALTVIDSFVFVEEDAPKLKAAVDKRREAIVAALRSAVEKGEPA